MDLTCAEVRRHAPFLIFAEARTDDAECSICRHDIVKGRRSLCWPCHISEPFHVGCVLSWAGQTPACPVCRTPGQHEASC